MSLAIKKGLFKLNITDHHAIIGVSIDADPKQIRLQYLKIAQKLHPDKCRRDSAKMKLSSQILSKLVNPAYEQLSRNGSFAEQQLILTQVGKRLAENKSKIAVSSESAQELLKAGNAYELVYPKLLKKLTSQQYKVLEQATDDISLISELNLIYLMLKCERGINRTPQKSSATVKPTINQKTVAQNKTRTTQPPTSPPKNETKVEEPSSESRVDAFVSRAQQYIAKGEYDQAVTELRDALRIDPNHAQAHAVMGKTYLHRQQLTMAKVHIDKAFKSAPHNPIVIESKKMLDKLGKKTNRSQSSKSNTDHKPANSGFFSGFFGAKKK